MSGYISTIDEPKATPEEIWKRIYMKEDTDEEDDGVHFVRVNNTFVPSANYLKRLVKLKKLLEG